VRRNLHHPILTLIPFKSCIHVLKKRRRYFKVILQDDYTAVVPANSRNTFDYRARQPHVLLSKLKGGAIAEQVPSQLTRSLNFRTIPIVSWPIPKHNDRCVSNSMAVKQTRDNRAQVLRTPKDK